jgi:hypothetical protein
MNSDEGVYMMHTRELHTLQLEIYKIGRSHILDNRMKQYPKGSKIICMINCENSILCEKELIKLFKEKFIQRLEYGTEYFEGNKFKMIKELSNLINSRNDDSMKKAEKKTDIVKKKATCKKTDKKDDINSSNNKIDRTCPKCNREFKYSSILRTHMKTSFHCILANEEIDNYISNQKKNKKIVKIVKPIQCANCKNCFKSNSSYNKHQNYSKCGINNQI